jgi:hypothetical protein
MSTSDLQHLRQRIESILAELGMPDALWSCVKATSFERDGERPHSGILVVWLTDRDVFEVYDENGRLLTTVSLDQEDECVRAA